MCKKSLELQLKFIHGIRLEEKSMMHAVCMCDDKHLVQLKERQFLGRTDSRALLTNG